MKITQQKMKTSLPKKDIILILSKYLILYRKAKIRKQERNRNLKEMQKRRPLHHLQLIKTEFMTCMRRRMLLPSAAAVVGRLLWCPSIWYTCSKMDLTWTTIMGSTGLIVTATSVIHISFLAVSFPTSQASCWRSARRTPWLRGTGTSDRILCKST